MSAGRDNAKAPAEPGQRGRPAGEEASPDNTGEDSPSSPTPFPPPPAAGQRASGASEDRGSAKSRKPPEVPTLEAPAGDMEAPTDQGPDAETTGPIDQPTIPLDLGPIVEPLIPKRDAPRSATEARRVAPDPEAGQVVGGYELLQKLGKGGAGSVFRARRQSDGEVVALKVLAASKAKRARIVQRFFDEVRAGSAVVHPGLIRVLDFIEEDEPRRLAYAMEFVDGESLRDRVKREGAFDLREAIHIGVEVCDSLSALHEAGIVHRDLKPENIMLLKPVPGSMPRIKLLDFGVVKFLPVDRTGGTVLDPSQEERAGTFVGTPRYMAPEQAAGGVVDARADLFAVGVLLFEMITGVCPHEGDSLRDVVMAKLKGAPRIKVNPGNEILPQELTEIVDACLQLKPTLRPRSAREVGRALKEAVAVLFVVGPVKADNSGSSFRLVEHSQPASGGAGAAPATLEQASTDPLMKRITPPPSGGTMREVVTPRRDASLGSSGVKGPISQTGMATIQPSSGAKGPISQAGMPAVQRMTTPPPDQAAPQAQPLAPPRPSVSRLRALHASRRGRLLTLLVILLVIAAVLVIAAIKLAPSEEEMLLVPLETQGTPPAKP